MRIDELLHTSNAGWVERGDERPPTYDPERDGEGPVAVALAVQATAPHPLGLRGEGRVWVVADTDWVTDELVDQAPGNASFLISGTRWLLGHGPQVAAVRPTQTVRRMALSPGQLAWMRVWLLGAVPLLVLALGGIVQWQRRDR